MKNRGYHGATSFLQVDFLPSINVCTQVDYRIYIMIPNLHICKWHCIFNHGCI
ncbi:MAG: hypothetical protein JJU02_02250 [Cryomorphaceae bacterium]|nr:hypothetical protein [Cryomorphaceae bacterium]